MVAMTHGLGLWLEAAGASAIPGECHAAVRQGEGPLPPTYCVPHKVSLVGHVLPGSGPAVVDIFQRVGSITLAAVEPGAVAEAALDWPTQAAEVRLRVTVVPVGETTEVPVLAQLPQPPQGLVEEILKPLQGEVKTQDELPEHPLLEEKEPEEKEPLPAAPTLALPPQPPTPQLPTPEEYKPISLHNCDQILPRLYLGGVQSVADPQIVADQGIRAVCCCLRDLEYPDSEFNKDLSYFRVDVEDMGHEPIELYFPQATEFIHSWISREQTVLVHCRAGVSRSASVVMAYLMQYQNYSLHDAFFLVRAHRSVVSPNIGFMEKLGNFEEEVHKHEPSIDILKYEGWYTSPERAAVPDLKPDD